MTLKDLPKNEREMPRNAFSGLYEGECWLDTEPEQMTWYQAVDRAAQDTRLRLPTYSNMLDAAGTSYGRNEVPITEFLPGKEYLALAYWGDNPRGTGPLCYISADHRHFMNTDDRNEKRYVKFVYRAIPE